MQSTPTAESARAIESTRAWLERFVIAHDICPFAGRESRGERIRFAVVESVTFESRLHAVAAECQRLDEHAEIATTLIIFSVGLSDFDDYLELLGLAESLLESLGYEGVYQLASFHPDYVFDGVDGDDVANYTNRSPYPMLHLLREAELEQALAGYPDPEQIPERNVARLREVQSSALSASLAALQESSDGQR